MSKEGDLTEGDGKGEEGNTLMYRKYIHKYIKVNYYAEGGKGEGRGVGIWGGLIDLCVHVYFYHPETHQDV